ncbi:hypothetical protein ACET3Z_025421 [Daucus carota]
MFLILPSKFCNMHGNTLQGNWILNIRKSYRMHVVYDRQNHRLLGISKLFSDFGIVGGEVLIFEFVDGSNFNLYIIGEDGNEIDYPSNGHASEHSSPETVSTYHGGWKFLKFISNADQTFDEVLLPKKFWRMFGSVIPEWFNYVLRNHFRFGGHFEFLERKLSGLRKICDGLRLSSFEKLELLVFTYESDGFFKLSLFDGSAVEVRLDVNEITFGTLFLTLRYPFEFDVRVMPSYMLKNCPGVKLPVQFCSKYSEVLYESMELKLRNGYILRVELDLVKCEMKGFLWFFRDMDLRGGELLLFEYFGRFSFNVYIIGDNGAEISYPDRVHCLQLCLPSIVSVGDGGWRFFSTRVPVESIFDEIDAPAEFIERCGLFLPERITYVLSNGKKFDGSYDSQSSRFNGLSKMSNIVGVDTMSVVRNLLLNYDGFKTISISAFDSEQNEVVFPGTPLCMDASGSYPLLNNYFQIIVENKHMSDDCFAVEISNEYNNLSIEWDNFQYLNIFTGLFSWRILVRKRDDHQCPTIEDGWKILRDGLALKVGNVCIFECPTLSYDQFRIRVLEGDHEM